ncbi:MAG: hypothetical protein Q9190_000771 [Brigantiaea leucoxantha]
MKVFRVRLNCIDHYQSWPTKFDLNLPGDHGPVDKKILPKIPVIRIFGSTETGQRVCAHIHGAFPYLYMEYQGSLIPEDVESYIHRLWLSIDHALAVSYRRNPYDGKTSFVAHISAVKGIPFYGYSVGYRIFLKVYLLDPLHMARLADLMRQGAIMKKILQPYESHMQYLAQWMCDYNLYGCAYIDCKKVKFRSPVPEFETLSNIKHQWHSRTISPSSISGEENLQRQSHCSIEVDVCVQDILNRLIVKHRPLHHDFIERKSLLPTEEKLVHSMASLWRDETKRRKMRMGLVDPSSSPFPPEVLVSVSADPRNSQPGGWIHEEEYKQRLNQIIADERLNSDGKAPSFESFVKKNSFEESIQTSLESVEDLFPKNLAKYHSTMSESAESDTLDGIIFDEVHVDVARTPSINGEQPPCGSDEEDAREMGNDQRRQENAATNAQLEDTNNDSKRTESTSPEASMQAPDKNISFSTTSNVAGTLADSFQTSASNDQDAEYSAESIDEPFQIPLEFASDISSRMGLLGKRKRLISTSGMLSKIQRLEKGEDQPTSHSLQGAESNKETGRKEPQLETPSQSGYVSYEDDNRNSVSQPVNSQNEGNPLDGQYQSLGSIAQDRSRTVVQNGNRSLSFPIVKSPRRANAMSRPNQGQDAPSESSSLIVHSAKFTSSIDRQPSESQSTPEKEAFPSQFSVLGSKMYNTFNIQKTQQLKCFAQIPPLSAEIELNPLPTLYQDPYFSEERDLPKRPREYAGKEFRIRGTTLPYLPKFDPTGMSLASLGTKPPVAIDRAAKEKQYDKQRRECSLRSWEIAAAPPSRAQVELWIEQDIGRDLMNSHSDQEGSAKEDLSQIDTATPKNRHGFKYSQKQKSTSVQRETQYMSTMSLEIHVNTREKLAPNPETDEVCCIFWCIQSEDGKLEMSEAEDGTHLGIIALSEKDDLTRKMNRQISADIDQEATELDLINRMVDIVRVHDPDILTGYEVHGSSWGYLIERAQRQYGYNLCDEFSRMKSLSHSRFGKENDRWGFNQTSTIRVTGRHMINIWRAMRGELNLLQYTMENVVFHLLHLRIPHYSHHDLTKWYTSGKPKDLATVLNHYTSRVKLNLAILEENELVPRTSEQARLLGVDFFSVFSRGSQFKVESLMFRIAKPENFLLPSPSRKQVGQQNALECLPLVMEPQSAFYSSPMLVLDFQSLYPSVMIAYNYCYSTFLGRVVDWRGQNKMGFTDYHREQRLLELFKDQINFAPNGMMYAKPGMRKSLLAKMLGEILETRVMVKSGMKVDKDDKTLQRLLNNRQLALKLIANVTYGYTSASFSGRMPCSEIADSIVQTARETLEKAIALIHSVERWGAEVVYGDTDSLFVYLKGRSKDEAFDIGNEIAKTITDMNPRPVKLKFEKVYLPCVLLAKKRYVGFKYESKAQAEPEFDAKGIETVRRDGTPAEQKIEEKALKLLFRTADLSQVKSYFRQQCTKIMKGRVSVQDFCFAREVKLGTYSGRGPPPPGALISTKRMLEDPRAEPQYGERVPYVVISGAPGARLIDRCVAPDVLLFNDHYELDAEYYISKNLIPPLERIFNLVGANVRQWYDEMPKVRRIRRIGAESLVQGKARQRTIEFYMKSSSCLVCRQKLKGQSTICDRCLQHAEKSLLTLRVRLNRAEVKAARVEEVCRSCAGLAWGEEIKCDSKDCPVFYTRVKHMASLKATRTDHEPIIRRLEEVGEGGLDW